jgi:hypothetical protein
LLEQGDDGTANGRLRHRRKRVEQPHRKRVGEPLSKRDRLPDALGFFHTVQQDTQGQVEGLGDLHQATDRDAIDPLLVFLKLLECNAQLVRDRFLRQIPLDAMKPDISSHDLIGLI